MATSQTHLVAQLQQSIRHLESVSRADDGSVVSSGCVEMDEVLPSDGYRRGTLVEWIEPAQRAVPLQSKIASGGHGLQFISLLAARQACEAGGALVIADPLRQFYPPAAVAMGISLANLIVLRPPVSQPSENSETDNGLFWAIDQALRCSAVAAVWGMVDQINERWFRRFQLSAESSGALGLFVRPATAAKKPSWAEVQWAARMPRSSSGIQTCKRNILLELARCRGGKSGPTMQIEIDTITGNVCGKHMRREHDQTSKKVSLSLAAQLAHPAPRRKSARA